jgi:hypothetical protein
MVYFENAFRLSFFHHSDVSVENNEKRDNITQKKRKQKEERGEVVKEEADNNK